MLESSMDADDLWMPNMLDRYLARPAIPEFESMSFATFGSNYRLTTCRKQSTRQLSDDEENDDLDKNKMFELQRGLGTIVKRKQPAVIRYPVRKRILNVILQILLHFIFHIGKEM